MSNKNYLDSKKHREEHSRWDRRGFLKVLGIAGATSKLYYYCSTGGHSGMGGNGEITLYPPSYASVGLVLALGG